jgi:S-adenosylmethionine uptake transporter
MAVASSEVPTMNLRGFFSPVVIVALCVFGGSGIDALVKGLAVSVPVIVLLAWRFMFGGIYMLAAYRLARLARPSWQAIRFHFMRTSIHISAAFLFFWGLTQLALAEATVLGFTAVLMVPPLGALILGETINKWSLGAALIGFGGAALALSASTGGAPEGTNRLLGAGAGLLSAFLYAVSLVLIRLRSRQEDPLTIAMFTNVFPGLMLLPFVFGSLPNLELAFVPVFALLGAMGAVLWYLMSYAYGTAPAQRLAPLEYTALVWASILGFVFFDEVPGWQLYVGAAIIIGACLLVAFEEKQAAPAHSHTET